MDYKQKLIELCDELQLSVRINGADGRINLYQDLGEYECAEQAYLWLQQKTEADKD